MTVKEFEDVADDICSNSGCKDCVLSSVCGNAEVGSYDVWTKIYPFFLEDIQSRILVRKWMKGNGYVRICK